MVRQLRARDFAGPPGWVRKFILASIVILQVAMIVFGGTLLAAEPTVSPANVRGATMLICAGAGALIAVYRDWRYRQPINRSPFFVAPIVLLIVVQAVSLMGRH
jgi:hypothetical protein